MRAKTPALAAIGAALFPLLTGTADAQDRRRAPVIKLSTALGSSVVSNYIEPSIRLSEDAYVFAISVDVDGNTQVLHPDFPGLSVKMMSGKQLHLPSFFAGYGGGSSNTSRRYATSSYADYDPGFTDTRGVVIALASRKPFNLDAVTSDGSWDLTTLERFLHSRDPHAAAMALARYIGARGEPIGRDVLRFAGAPRYYSSSAFYECNSYGRLGYGHFFHQWRVDSFRAAQLRAAGYAVTFLGTDACGEPRFAVHGQGLTPRPVGRPPAKGAFPRSRIPIVVPRNPTGDQAVGDRMAARSPLGHRPSEGGVSTNSPRGRTAESRPAVDRSQRPTATGSFPDRRPVATPAPQVERPRPAPPQVESRPAPRQVESRPTPRDAERGGKPVDQ